eukprot:scaffold2893_cov254-Pinguiococcus_pyrenoidosus.AAC.9
MRPSRPAATTLSALYIASSLGTPPIDLRRTASDLRASALLPMACISALTSSSSRARNLSAGLICSLMNRGKTNKGHAREKLGNVCQIHECSSCRIPCQPLSQLLHGVHDRVLRSGRQQTHRCFGRRVGFLGSKSWVKTASCRLAASQERRAHRLTAPGARYVPLVPEEGKDGLRRTEAIGASFTSLVAYSAGPGATASIASRRGNAILGSSRASPPVDSPFTPLAAESEGPGCLALTVSLRGEAVLTSLRAPTPLPSASQTTQILNLVHDR